MKNLFFLLLLLTIGLKTTAQTLYFPPSIGSTWDTMSPASLGWCPDKIDSLVNYLGSQNTKAFILLKDGKIVLEEYFDNFTKDSLWYWASAGKTLTAFMVGIAEQENYLSINDTTSQYLGQGWTNCSVADEEKITIWNQLTMTSGLDDGVPDHFCTLDTCLNCIATPSSRWAYHNGPYTLLDGVIQNATGQTLNSYTTQKLKTPTGMTGLFYPSGYNNVFVSTPRSMARFGLLILNQGNWNGNQLLNNTYFQQMTNTSQNINESYGYLWWLNGKSSFKVPGLQLTIPGSFNPAAPADMFAALGKNGQFINVVPSQNLVFIRLGNAPSSTDVPFFMNDTIWQKLNDMTCLTTTSILNTKKAKVEVFPNPIHQQASVKIAAEYLNQVVTFELFNTLGERVLNFQLTEQQMDFNRQNLPAGVYWFSVRTEQKLLGNGKVLLE